MTLQTLFQRQNEIVRDNAAVLVKREVTADGAVLYRKSFKQQPA